MAKILVKKMNKQGDSGNLRAFVDVSIAEKVTIIGCRLLDGQNGMWVAMPSRKKDEKYYDIVKITDQPLKDDILAAVLEAYNKDTKAAATTVPPEEDF